MDFIDEINAALGEGLEGFKVFIQKKLKENKDYLKQLFWFQGGGQVTVLNYLIHLHQEPKEGAFEITSNLNDHVDYILSLPIDKNIGEPLHQAVASGKTDLAIRLLNSNKEKSLFNVEQRDAEGHTLFSLILRTKNANLLTMILSHRPNVNSVTMISGVLVQPLHQAIILDFADAIPLLQMSGAQLSNKVGKKCETPVLLAARLGKINALRALLDFPPESLLLEAENHEQADGKTTSNTAIEELCLRIANDKNPEEALQGIAMLLCCGAEPPRSVEWCNLLSKKRDVLLKEIHNYLEDKPRLVNQFVHRCHLKESPLHNIIYADHSWGSSIRHLFGRPSDAALIIEGLVSRAHKTDVSGRIAVPNPSSRITTNATAADEGIKLYAEFVRRYNEAYNSQRFTNRWSTMRWMIAEGMADWDTVVRYSKSNPTSRTRIIIDDMFAPPPDVHDVVVDQAQVAQHLHTHS